MCRVVLCLLAASLVLSGPAAAIVTERVSVDSLGVPGDGPSGIPTASEDGRYVCFTSEAANLAPDDTNGAWDVFVFDRQTGITRRVSTSSTGAQANAMSQLGVISKEIQGYLMTSSGGERYVEAYEVQPLTSTWTIPVTPLAMNNRSLGGGDWLYDFVTGQGQMGVDGGVGLNNIGLLVRTTGKITGVDPSPDPRWFVIDDGSGVGVTCELPEGVSYDDSWGQVTVTGISSLFWGNDVLSRRLLVRAAGDVTVVRRRPPERPSFVAGMTYAEAYSPSPQNIAIITLWPARADSMKLYASTDGSSWTDSGIPVERVDDPWGPMGWTAFNQYTNAYFRFTAVNPAGESEPSDRVFARPFEVEFNGIVGTSPAQGAQDAPLVPTFCWSPTWSAQPPWVTTKYYMIELDTGDVNWYPIWRVSTLLSPPQSCVTYSQTADVDTSLYATGPLLPNAPFHYDVLAFDQENWAFAHSPFTHFTTGDDIPPPPP